MKDRGQTGVRSGFGRFAGGAAIVLLLNGVGFACAQSTSNSGVPVTSVASPAVKTGSPVAASPAVPAVSPSASGPVQIVDVRIGGPDATIRLQNLSPNQSGDVDLHGWVIQVGSTNLTLPADLRIRPGEILALHTNPAPAATAPPSTPPPSPVSSPGPVREIPVPDPGGTMRAALQPGAQVQLIDERQRIVSQFVVPR